MKKIYQIVLPILLVILVGNVEAQISFKNKNTKLINSNFHSGCTMAIARKAATVDQIATARRDELILRPITASFPCTFL